MRASVHVERPPENTLGRSLGVESAPGMPAVIIATRDRSGDTVLHAATATGFHCVRTATKTMRRKSAPWTIKPLSEKATSSADSKMALTA
jgi:hypothetical protein